MNLTHVWLNSMPAPSAALSHTAQLLPLTPGKPARIVLPSSLDKLDEACNRVLNQLPLNTSTESRTQVKTALLECLSNAVIHGNLEIDSSLRKAGNWKGYQAQLRARQADPHYNQRQVMVEFGLSEQGLHLAVEDQGPGYTPRGPDQLPDVEELLLAEAGRGLILVRHIAQQVRFNARGNRIEMLIPL